MAKQRLLTRPFVLCGVANLAQVLAFNLFLHLPGFLHDLGADDARIGLLFGLTAVSGIAVRPPIGRIIDLRGRRSVILAGGLLNVAVCSLYLGVGDLGPGIYAIRVLHGLSQALLFTSLFTYAADLVPVARRTEGLALFGVSGMLPIALAGVLGDWILSRSGFDVLFATAAAFALASLLLSLPLPEAAGAAPGARAGGGFRACLRQRDLRPLWWIGTIFSLALASCFAFIRRYVDESGVGSVGGFFTAYSGAALVVRLLFGWAPDRFGPKRLLSPSLLTLGAGFAWLALARDATDVALAGLLCGVGHGFAFPILFALVVARAGEPARGSAMAVFTSLFDLGILLGGPLFGGISEWLGYPALYATAAGVLLLGVGVFLLWDRRR